MTPDRWPPASPPGSTVLGVGPCTRLALAYLALVLYGSLVPFWFRPMPMDLAVARFRAIPYYRLGIESRSDWVANILLFIPLSFLAMAALCVDCRRRRGRIAAPAVVASCAALSVAIEFTQVFFPPRTVSQNDVAAESLGGLLGTLLWLGAGQATTDWARRTWAAFGTRGLAARLLPGYLALLVLIHVMPLDLTISPLEVYHKFRQGRVRLVPFYRPGIVARDLIQKDLWNVAYFAPLGLLIARVAPRGGGLLALGAGFAAASVIESLQLFVHTRAFDATDVVTGALAVGLGWWGARAGLRFPGRATRPAFLPAWLVVAAAVAWQPFDFDGDPARAFRRFRALSPVPFADYYWGTEFNAFDQLLRKTLLFLPVGALLGPGRLTVPIGFAVAAALEVGQLFLPSRTASLTDVLIAGFGAWIGSSLARHARRDPPPYDPETS